MFADLYDFDGTVFNGESGTLFTVFCYKKNPKLIRYIFHQFKFALKYYAFKKCSEEEFKEALYIYLKDIDAEKLSREFWEKNKGRMNSWFRPLTNDLPVVICSASPLFQIKPICDELGVTAVIATDMNHHNGKINGKNCKGNKKAEHLKTHAGKYEFRDVYTDNIKSDSFILNLAKRNKYHVKNGVITKL